MSRRRVAAPSGFTLIETLMVVVVIGLVAAIAMPRVDTSRYTMNAAARGISSTLSYAQRMAISQQSNINVAFDAVQRGLRVHEDRNNDLAIDAGERVLFHPLPDGVTFGRGAAPARPFGPAAIQLARMQGALPVLIYRRDGTVSEEAGFYLSTIAGLAANRATDVRAVEFSRATGRATWFSYAAGSWKRGT